MVVESEPLNKQVYNVDKEANSKRIEGKHFDIVKLERGGVRLLPKDEALISPENIGKDGGLTV